ncbi:MAG: glycosyltransferase family 39 protein [Acidimicrobiia bacterium]|nr:glycosyltransferase family 39 protein [Acidimicrobiia bacterium]
MGALGARLATASPFARRLGVVAAVALLWRVAYGLLFKYPNDGCGQMLCGDALYYVRQAQVIAGGGFFDDPAAPGMPAADHPPLTALLLVPAAALPYVDVGAARITMAVVGMLVVVVLGLLGRELAGERAGLVAAGLAAANPNLWMNDALPMSEAPAALAVAVVLLGAYRLAARPTPRAAVVLGVCCGLAVLTRGELALLVPFTVLPALLAAPGAVPLRRRLGTWVIVGAVGVATVVPWTLFNLVRFSEPALLSTNEGLTIVGANCDAVYHGGGLGFWNLGCAEELGHLIPEGADQSERSHIYRDEGLDYISNNVDRLPTVALARFGRVWNLYDPAGMVWLNQGEGRESWASWAGMWWFWLTTPLAVAGLVVLRRRQVSIAPLVSTAVVVSVTAVLFYGIVRFRVPADVAATVAAAVALTALIDRWQPPDRAPAGTAADEPRPQPAEPDR